MPAPHRTRTRPSSLTLQLLSRPACLRCAVGCFATRDALCAAEQSMPRCAHAQAKSVHSRWLRGVNAQKERDKLCAAMRHGAACVSSPPSLLRFFRAHRCLLGRSSATAAPTLGGYASLRARTACPVPVFNTAFSPPPAACSSLFLRASAALGDSEVALENASLSMDAVEAPEGGTKRDYPQCATPRCPLPAALPRTRPAAAIPSQRPRRRREHGWREPRIRSLTAAPPAAATGGEAPATRCRTTGGPRNPRT